MDLQSFLANGNPWWWNPAARRRSVKPNRRRAYFERLAVAATAPNMRSLVLRGPRRVGKTQLLLQLADWLLSEVGLLPGRLLYVDLSDPLLAPLGRGPELLESLLSAWPPGSAPGPRVALLDEIQTVPEWDAWLKHTLDWNEDLRVIATGSSSLNLAHGGRESGRGRWDDLTIEGLTFPERLDLLARDPESTRERTLSRQPQLIREHLELGGLPEYIGSNESRIEIRRHMRAEVDRELAAELAGVVKDVDVTRRLFLTFAQDSGEMHGRKKLSDALGIDRNTLDRHIEALSDMLLIHRLGPVTGARSGAPRNIRSRLADDKIYVAEPGHVGAFASTAEPLENGTVAGRIFETTVYHALRSVARELDCSEIGYLRIDQDREIDFVLALPGGKVGIEVTASDREDKKVSQARAAKDKFDIPLLVVAGAMGSERTGDVPSIDLQRFLLDPVAAIRRMLA